MRGDLSGFVADFARGNGGGGSVDRSASACIRTQSIRSSIRVAFFDFDVFSRDAQFLGNDLSVSGFMPLPLRLGPKARDRLARWMDADFTGAEHFQSEDIEVFRGTTANNLSERRNANTHEFTAG